MNGFAGNGGQGAAIKIDAGTLQNCHVFGGAAGGGLGGSMATACRLAVARCRTRMDSIMWWELSNVDRLRSDLFTAWRHPNGPAFRAAASGSRFATWRSIQRWDICSTPATRSDSELRWRKIPPERSTWSLPICIAPTGVTATAATGGTLAAATYYATVTSTSDNCTHQSPQSLQSAGVALSGSNNAVQVSWTAPTAGLSPGGGLLREHFHFAGPA